MSTPKENIPMPVDPKTVRVVTDFLRRVGFAAARGAAAETQRTATAVAEPVLERAESVAGVVLDVIKSARAAVAHERDKGDPR
jgi:hypothetical protein